MTTKKEKTPKAKEKEKSTVVDKNKLLPVQTEDSPTLIAYRLNKTKMPIITAQTNREWMEQTPSRFAYRCMPMLLANQAGWMILSGYDISVAWDGRPALEGLTVLNLGGEKQCSALSIFGSGILTFTLPYLFRTPPGYNLIAQGPTNSPKDGIAPLSGIIETDWAESTFTMNWMFTRPHHTVTFAKDEPICMIVPQRRYELENINPIIRDVSSDPELHADYLKWADSRRQFNEDLKKDNTQARKDGWQKHYAQGKTVSEKRSTSHQSKLVLREFMDETES
jgi:hypothetical protein